MKENESVICGHCGIRFYNRYNGKQCSCPNHCGQIPDHNSKHLRDTISAQDVSIRWKTNDVDFIGFVFDHMPGLYFEWDENNIALPWKKTLLPWRKDSRTPVHKFSLQGEVELMSLFTDELLVFERKNIEEFEEENPELTKSVEIETTKNKRRAVEIVKPDVQTQCVSERENRFYFISEVDGWDVAFKGKAARLDNLKGLTYIAQLLCSPGQDVYTPDLYNIVDKTTDDQRSETREDIQNSSEALLHEHRGNFFTSTKLYNEMNYEQLSEEGMHSGEDSPVEFTSLTSELRTKLRDILEGIHDDNPAVSSESRDRFKKLTKDHPDSVDAIMDEATRIEEKNTGAKKTKKTYANAEQTRVSVTKAIETAYQNMNKRGLTSLVTFFKKHIHKGNPCKYEPHPEYIEWEIKLP
jgi:hypothetical protein